MAIITRFGTPVEILGKDKEVKINGWVFCRVFYDGEEPSERWINAFRDLKADEGINEIWDLIESEFVPIKTFTEVEAMESEQ